MSLFKKCLMVITSSLLASTIILALMAVHVGLLMIRCPDASLRQTVTAVIAPFRYEVDEFTYLEDEVRWQKEDDDERFDDTLHEAAHAAVNWVLGNRLGNYAILRHKTLFKRGVDDIRDADDVQVNLHRMIVDLAPLSLWAYVLPSFYDDDAQNAASATDQKNFGHGVTIDCKYLRLDCGNSRLGTMNRMPYRSWAHGLASRILSEHREDVIRLAARLREKGILDAKDIEKVLGPPPRAISIHPQCVSPPAEMD